MQQRLTRFIRLLLLTACLAPSACAARHFDRLMQDWEGRPLSQLLTTWGPPTSVYSDGNGGHVIVYLPATVAPPAGPRRAPASGPQLADEILHGLGSRPVYRATARAEWPIYRLFLVDPEGGISKALWKGEWVCCGM